MFTVKEVRQVTSGASTHFRVISSKKLNIIQITAAHVYYVIYVMYHMHCVRTQCHGMEIDPVTTLQIKYLHWGPGMCYFNIILWIQVFYCLSDTTFQLSVKWFSANSHIELASTCTCSYPSVDSWILL